MIPIISLNTSQVSQAKSLAAHLLCRTFARTFDVEPPFLLHLAPDDALFAFREFSAACMEEALASPAYAAARRAELERRAFNLGRNVRAALNPRDDELRWLISYFYAIIGIGVSDASFADGAPDDRAPDGNKTLSAKPTTLRFHRCYFSERYTPDLCAFMSAFDSGFVGGLCGGGSLAFSARITEGAPCCLAALSTISQGGNA